jgi:hypothetical protein
MACIYELEGSDEAERQGIFKLRLGRTGVSLTTTGTYDQGLFGRPWPGILRNMPLAGANSCSRG